MRLPKIVVSVLCAVFLAGAFVSVLAEGTLTLQDLKKVSPKSPEHPYLYFSKADLPKIRKNIQEDPRCAAVWERLLLEGKRLIIMPMPQEPARQNIGRFYTDNVYEDYHRLTLKGAFILSFLYAVTGEKKYLDRAYQFADAFCLLPTWVFRAHEFPVIEGRLWPWGVDQSRDQVVFSFDHITGDAAREMAAVYDWLYSGLTRVERNRIRGALLENAILRVRNAYEYQWWASAYRCNWVAVCNSGLGLAALSIYTENPEMLDVVVEANNRINKMFDQIGQDGEWQEGTGYWNYALSTALYFMDGLKRFSGGKINMVRHPKLNSTFDFPLWTALPGNKVVDFCDADLNRRIGNFPFYAKFAEETQSPVASFLANAFSAPDTDPFSILWNRTTVAPAIPAPKQGLSKHFRTIDWLVFRTQWDDSSAPVLVAKAGIHDDPHHGHLDAGSFLLNYRGENLIKDLGRPVYDEEVFDSARWSVPYCNSLGHNVVFVNKEAQMPGASYFGKVEAFTPGDKVDYARMNLSRAYPGKQLKGWTRHILFHKPDLFILMDEVQSAPGAEIECRFHPGGEFSLYGRAVVVQGKQCAVGVLPLWPKDITPVKGMHSYLPMQLKAEMQNIPCFDLRTKAKTGITYLLTLLVPGEKPGDVIAVDGKAAAEMVNDKLSYHMEYKGKTYGGAFALSSKGALFQEKAE